MISVTSIFITSFFSQRQLGNFFSKILVYKYLVSLLCSCSLLNNIKDSIFFSINNHLTAFFDIRFTSKMGLVSNKLSCGGLIACFTHQNYLDTIFFLFGTLTYQTEIPPLFAERYKVAPEKAPSVLKNQFLPVMTLSKS